MTSVIISGMPVDAVRIIDTLSAMLAEKDLTIAALRVQNADLLALATAHVVDGAPAAPVASESPLGASPLTFDTGPGYPRSPDAEQVFVSHDEAPYNPGAGVT